MNRVFVVLALVAALALALTLMLRGSGADAGAVAEDGDASAGEVEGPGAERGAGEDGATREAASIDALPAVGDEADPARGVLLRVVDAATTAPLEGARASVRAGWSGAEIVGAVTDAAGEARLVGLPRHPDLTLVVSKRGALRQRRTLRADEESVVVALAPGFAADGVVRARSDGRAIAGAVVTARTEWDFADLADPLTTGADGRFALDGVPIGEPFVVAVAAEGYRPFEQEELWRRAGGELDLVLERGGLVEGRVSDVRGAFVAGARVALRGAVEERSGVVEVDAVTTDARGRFEFAGVDPALVGVVVASKGGVGFARGPGFDLGEEPASTLRRDLVLRPSRTGLAVRVVDADDRPVPGVRLSMTDPEGRPPVSPLTGELAWELRFVERGGWRVAEPLEPGAYVVVARIAGRPAEAREVQVVPEVRTEVVVRLSGGLSLEGHVRAPDGAPVPDRTVLFLARAGEADPGEVPSLWREEPGYEGLIKAVTDTDAAGAFHLEGLPDVVGVLRVGDVDGIGFDGFDADWSAVELEGVRPGGAPLEVTLVPAPRVVGRVAPVPTGQLIECQADIRVAGWFSDVALDAEGRFELRFSRVGRPFDLLLVPIDGAPWFFRDVTLAPGETRDLGVLRVQSGGRVEGRVVDSAGVGLGDVHVSASPEEWWWERDALSAGDGRFALEHLPVGVGGRVHCDREGYLDQSFEVSDFATAAPLPVVLVRPSVVVGVVTEDDVPRAGVRVELGDDDTTVTAADGSFRLVGRPGRTSLIARGEGGAVRASTDLDLSEGRETRADLTLR